MTARAPRICRCGKVVAFGDLCTCQTARQQQRKAKADVARPSARNRGYGTKWQKAREAFLKEHPTCVRCGKPSCVVDHVTPHRGDTKLFWSRTNWQALCRSCHSRWKQRQEHTLVKQADKLVRQRTPRYDYRLSSLCIKCFPTNRARLHINKTVQFNTVRFQFIGAAISAFPQINNRQAITLGFWAPICEIKFRKRNSHQLNSVAKCRQFISRNVFLPRSLHGRPNSFIHPINPVIGKITQHIKRKIYIYTFISPSRWHSGLQRSQEHIRSNVRLAPEMLPPIETTEFIVKFVPSLVEIFVLGQRQNHRPLNVICDVHLGILNGRPAIPISGGYVKTWTAAAGTGGGSVARDQPQMEFSQFNDVN